jgi:hypothetical protein
MNPLMVMSMICQKRILDVSNSGESGKVCLREFDAPTQSRYVALSHCWGKTLPIRVTTENILEHIQGISMLTQTFLDSAFLTRRLRIQYLWVDSLCILQDSKSDWETEVAKMGDYYRLSWLTIATGMSADGLKGCFAARDSPSGPYCALDMPSQRDQRPVTLYFTVDPLGPPIRGSNAEMPLDKSPLHKRG